MDNVSFLRFFENFIEKFQEVLVVLEKSVNFAACWLFCIRLLQRKFLASIFLFINIIN